MCHMICYRLYNVKRVFLHWNFSLQWLLAFMNNQLQAAELLRQAAAALTNTTTSTNNPTDSDSSKPSTSVQSVQSAVRNAFAPYRQVRARGSCNMCGRAGQLAASSSYWTHRFCVLASTSQVNLNYLDYSYLIMYSLVILWK